MTPDDEKTPDDDGHERTAAGDQVGGWKRRASDEHRTADAMADTAPEDEPTADWPTPREDAYDQDTYDQDADESTAAIPIPEAAYPPPSDPYFDEDEFPSMGYGFLPAWEEQPAAPRRKRRLLLVAGAFVVMVGLVTTVLLVPHGGTKSTAQGLSAPTAGVTAASFEVVDGASQVRITAADLGGNLYRVSGSGINPHVERSGGAVKLSLPSNGNGTAAVDIVLDKRVRWTLKLDGGTSETQVNLGNAEVGAVDLGGGSSRIDLTLPAPRGLVPVRMTGGVDQFQVNLAGSTPVRVSVQSGAGEVTLDGATHRGIAPGQVFTAYGWNPAGNGIDLTAVAGLSALTVIN